MTPATQTHAAHRSALARALAQGDASIAKALGAMSHRLDALVRAGPPRRVAGPGAAWHERAAFW